MKGWRGNCVWTDWVDWLSLFLFAQALKGLKRAEFLCQPDAARIIAVAAKFKIVLEKSVDRPCRLRCVVRRQTVGRIGDLPVLA